MRVSSPIIFDVYFNYYDTVTLGMARKIDAFNTVYRTLVPVLPAPILGKALEMIINDAHSPERVAAVAGSAIFAAAIHHTLDRETLHSEQRKESAVNKKEITRTAVAAFTAAILGIIADEAHVVTYDQAVWLVALVATFIREASLYIGTDTDSQE